MSVFADVDDVVRRFDDRDYLLDEGTATALYLAVELGRPLLLEGEPGVGKTTAAKALAAAVGTELIRLQCYEGLAASEALYDWNYQRQLLAIRLAETRGETLREADLYTEEFLLERPVLRCVRHRGPTVPVLLIDEIDRADDEFEAFLLQVLDENAVTIPELGQVRAQTPPLVVLTSNRTREVHDALKRRCLYHWLEHPDLAREVEILRRRIPGIDEHLAAQVAHAVQAMRGMDLLKPPGVAESLDWARALRELDRDVLDATTAAATLGAVLKYREDLDRVVRTGLDRLLTG